MRGLRYGRLWLCAGYAMVLLLLAASLAPPPPGMVMTADKSLHLLAYLVLALWFGAIYRRERFARVGLALAGLGVLIECLQSLTGYRSFEWADMLADGLGIGAGLLVAATPLGGWLLWAERRLPGHA